jgi:hypothetical protein
MAHTRPASFVTTGLVLSTDEATPGETITASIIINNEGDLTGTSEVNLLLDNQPLQSMKVTLAGGGSNTIVFNITPDSIGQHSANIGTMMANFMVKRPPTPANFTVSELKVEPLSSVSGDNINASVLVKNNGDISGTYGVTLMVDGAAVNSREIALASGGSGVVNFSFTPDAAGQHQVSIGSLMAQFEVKPYQTPAGNEPPRLTGFSVVPDYDQATNTLAYARITYQMNQAWESIADMSLMLTVFHNTEFLEQVPLLTLSQRQTDGQTGELDYIPSTGWQSGEYSFRAELYQGENLVQDTALPKLTVAPQSTNRIISWKTLGIVIGSTLALGIAIVMVVLYFRRDTMRDYWK